MGNYGEKGKGKIPEYLPAVGKRQNYILRCRVANVFDFVAQNCLNGIEYDTEYKVPGLLIP